MEFNINPDTVFMEENEDGSVSNVSESTVVTVREVSAGESVVEGSCGEGQCGGSVSEGDGEDIMVEVLGSEVLVDGVGGQGVGRGSNEEACRGGLLEVGLERQVKSVDGEGGDLLRREIGVSGGGEVSNLETDSRVRGSSEVAGFSGEQTQFAVANKAAEAAVAAITEAEETGKELIDGEDDGASDLASHELSTLDDRSRNREIDGGDDVVGDLALHEVSGLDDEAQIHEIDGAVEGSVTAVQSLSEQNQVVSVKEVSCEEILERRLVGDGVGRDEASVDAVDDSTSQQVGILDYDAQNPGSDNVVGYSSDTAGMSLNVTARVTVDETVAMVREEFSDNRNEFHGSDTLEKILSCTGKDQVSTVDMCCGGAERDSVIQIKSDSVDDGAQVADGRVVVEANKEEIVHSETEGVGNSVFNGNLYCSAEYQLLKIETEGRNLENSGNVCVGSGTYCDSTETVARDELGAMENMVPSNLNAEVPKIVDSDGDLSLSKNDQSLKDDSLFGATEKYNQITGKGEMASTGIVILNAKTEVVGRAALDQNMCSQRDQLLEVDPVDGNLGKDVFSLADSESSIKQTQAADVGDPIGADYKDSIPGAGAGHTDSLNETSACSEDNQNSKFQTACRNSDGSGTLHVETVLSNEQNGVAEQANDSLMEDKSELSSKVGVFGVDALSGNYSVKDQELKVVAVCRTTESDTLVGADKESTVEQTEINSCGGVVGEEEFCSSEGEVLNAYTLERSSAGAENDQNMQAEEEFGSTLKNNIVLPNLESSDQQIQVSNGGAKSSTDLVGVLDSKVKEQDPDVFYGSLYGSEKNEELMAKTAGGSTEKGGSACADSGPSVNPIEVVRQDVAMVNSEDAPKSRVEVPGDDICCSQKDEELNVMLGDGNEEKGDDVHIISVCSTEEAKIGFQVESLVIDVDNKGASNSTPDVPGNEASTLSTSKDHLACGDPDSRKIERAIGSPKIDGVLHEDPSLGIESPSIGDFSSSVPVKNSGSLGENISLEEKKQETVVQLAGTHEVSGDQCTNTLAVDETIGQEACVSGISDSVVEITVQPQGAINTPAFHNECDHSLLCVSDFINPLPDGSQDLEVQEVSNRIHLQDRDHSKSSPVFDIETSHEVENQVVAVENKYDEAREGKVDFPVLTSRDDGAIFHLSEVGSSVGQEVEVEGQIIDIEKFGLQEGEEIQGEGQAGSEQPKSYEERTVKRTALKPGSSVRVHQATYELPPETEGEFSVSDLVWGKVRSHPWWPGQIFDPSDSSEKAMKYLKKDCYFIAYFGDRTFAWNEASLLKPFRTHFSQIEKQGTSEAFHNAVNCALDEVSRRVELGLACSCIPKEVYDEIKHQIVENTGIRQELSRRDGVDKSASVDSFEPDKLVEYVNALAQFPSAGADRLELVIAKAQLLAFSRSKGLTQLPEFQFCGGLLENDADTPLVEEKMHSIEVRHATPKDDEYISSGKETLKSPNSSSHKRKHNLKDSVYPRKKEKSLLELMSGTPYSPDEEDGPDDKTSCKLVSPSSSKKRRAADSFADDTPDRRKSIILAKVSQTTSLSNKQSFKVGECISRVASQLTKSPSILKCSGDKLQKVDAGSDFDVSSQTLDDSSRGKMIVSVEFSSLDEMLGQLHLAAREPLKGYSFLSNIVSFFSDYRNSIIPEQYSVRNNVSMDRASGGRKKKSSHSMIGSPETFEFEDMNDSYWTDMVVQNTSEEQPSRRGRKRRGGQKLVTVEHESSHLYGNEMAVEKPAGYDDERKQDPSPTELILNFAEVDSLPSENNLNKMFRRFGPLKESETEVDRMTSRARVVFKRCSDAEVACSSAGTFNIFGSTVVNYQLCYSPSVSFKTSPLAITEGLEYTI